MSVSVEFPEQPKATVPSKGSAGLSTQLGGHCTTVSLLKEASKAIGNASYVKKDIG